MLSDCGFDLEWNDCYGTNKKYWVKSAFEHPAKASPDLCNRIIDHLEELGILTENSIIIDPMAGIGTSLLTAAVRGYKTIGIELEPKFVDLINKNIAFIKEKEYLDYTPIIIQGDARKLSDLLTERNLISITSPPYDSETVCRRNRKDNNRLLNEKGIVVNYGLIDGQIGNMKDKVAITSPPYGLGKGTGHSEGDIKNSSREIKTSKKLYQYYGEYVGNIGNMLNNVVISSPPYVGSDTTRIRGRKCDIERMIKKGIKVNPDSNSQTTKELYYGTSPDQIGNLKDDNIVTITSPPYLDTVKNNKSMSERNDKTAQILKQRRPNTFDSTGVGNSCKAYSDVSVEGQIGNLPDVNTYQGAILKVYQEMYKCCSAAAIITKNPTKKKQIYPLDKITISLLELAGWKIKCVHHAVLCWEELEDDKTVLKGRVGFFKRLQWQKGQPIAMFEDVIIVIK